MAGAPDTMTPKLIPILLALPLAALLTQRPIRAQVVVSSSYLESFNSLGTALPPGWGVWTSSTATGNGTAFSWDPAAIANNAAASAATYFRNVPGASQAWTLGLAAGSDRALGWRAGSSGSRDGSITFSLTDTVGWSLTALSFQLFTPNSSGTAGVFELEYQIGSTATFTSFSPLVTYTNNVAQSPLVVTTITVNAAQLAPLANQSGQITLRWNNTASTGTSWNTLALDNFSYTASAIPEPAASATLAGAAIFTLALWRRKQSRRVR